MNVRTIELKPEAFHGRTNKKKISFFFWNYFFCIFAAVKSTAVKMWCNIIYSMLSMEKITASQKKQINAVFSKFMFFNCVTMIFEEPIQRENFLTFVENTPIGGSPLACEEIFVSRMYNGAEKFVYFFQYRYSLVEELIYQYFDKYPLIDKKGGILA